MLIFFKNKLWVVFSTNILISQFIFEVPVLILIAFLIPYKKVILILITPN